MTAAVLPNGDAPLTERARELSRRLHALGQELHALAGEIDSSGCMVIAVMAHREADEMTRMSRDLFRYARLGESAQQAIGV